MNKQEETFLNFYGCLFAFPVNRANFFHVYGVITISIVLVITREKFLGNDFNPIGTGVFLG